VNADHMMFWGSMTVYGSTELTLGMCIVSPVWLENVLHDTNRVLLLHQRQ
jgi:hypothetical protein